MPGKETFKLVLVSIIFTISALIALPEIPFVVNSKLWIIDSAIGGYKIKIPRKDGEKVIDLSNFKKDSEIGESQKIIYSLKDRTSDNKDQFLSEVEKTIKKRLSLMGIADFSVGREGDNIFVIIPEYEDFDRVNQMLLGNGKMMFKTLKDPGGWSSDKAQEIFFDTGKWQDTGITEHDIQNLIYTIDPASGDSRMIISFTSEGKKKFYDLAEKNVNLPIAIYMNDSEYPFLMPLISETLLKNDKNTDPSVTIRYPKQVVEDYNLQLKNPLPADIVYVDKTIVTPPIGVNFISKYVISFVIALILISIFFVIKFNLTGIIFTYALICSISVFAALAKLLSLSIGPVFLSASILVTGIISSLGYLIFNDMKSGLNEGKPFDIIYYQVFGKAKEKLSAPSIFMFSASLLFMLITTGRVRVFMSVLTVGMLSVILFYSFLLPTLLFALGRDEK